VWTRSIDYAIKDFRQLGASPLSRAMGSCDDAISGDYSVSVAIGKHSSAPQFSHHRTVVDEFAIGVDMTVANGGSGQINGPPHPSAKADFTDNDDTHRSVLMVKIGRWAMLLREKSPFHPMGRSGVRY
jgi:hypothetical protein